MAVRVTASAVEGVRVNVGTVAGAVVLAWLPLLMGLNVALVVVPGLWNTAVENWLGTEVTVGDWDMESVWLLLSEGLKDAATEQ